eukprot:1071114-Rhodomonas_salina.1
MGNDVHSIHDRILALLPEDSEPVEPVEQDVGSKRKHADCESAVPAARSAMRLELDTLLSRLPYKKLMQEMISYSSDKPLPSVPYVTRQYEEAYMREPRDSTERACAMGDECECMFIDRTNAFVGVEFIVPGEQPQPNPEFCVLCSSVTTQQLFFDVVFDGVPCNALMQRYGNIHGVQNEYAQDV